MEGVVLLQLYSKKFKSFYLKNQYLFKKVISLTLYTHLILKNYLD